VSVFKNNFDDVLTDVKTKRSYVLPCPVNIAFGKVASQSSTFNNLSASLANDGDLDSCMSTDHELKPWWQVDLGNFYHVIEVTIYTRADRECEIDGFSAGEHCSLKLYIYSFSD
jgi:hypothetical protein